MANRVSGDEVKAIMHTSLTADELAPFITGANLIVTRELTGEGLSDANLKQIERWLSAHLALVMMGGQASAEKEGDVSVNYASVVKAGGLDSTLYGQQVKILDSTGRLADMGKKRAYLECLNDDSS